MWSEARFLSREPRVGVLAVIRGFIEDVDPRREYEVWEASENLLPFFQVAGHLKRRDAVRIADRHASVWPRQPVLVLNREGASVYSAYHAKRATPAVPAPPIEPKWSWLRKPVLLRGR